MKHIAYFDNAATTFPKPEVVYTFTDKFYRECGVNVGRGQHLLASRAASLVSETRELLLDLNHCPNKRVVFTHTATEALNVILQGLPWQEKMTVYVSPFEHNAVMRVLVYLKTQYNLNIETLCFNKSRFEYDLSGIKEQFANRQPNVVVMSHASNVCGIIAPTEEISSLSKQYKAINMVDMCQTMGLIETNLSSENIDFAVFAGHKTLYAPFGVAGFICSANADVKPLLFGGTGIDSASEDLPSTIPQRYEVGSPNIMAIAGLNASLHWIKEIGIQSIHAKECENHSKLLKILEKYDNIRVEPFGKKYDAIGVVSCTFDGYSSDSIGQILSDKGIAVRTGLHCSPNAHKFLGTFPSGTVRFSLSYFNSDEDFIALDEALLYIYENS
jgi:cysteine desulfurase family protein